MKDDLRPCGHVATRFAEAALRLAAVMAPTAPTIGMAPGWGGARAPALEERRCPLAAHMQRFSVERTKEMRFATG